MQLSSATLNMAALMRQASHLRPQMTCASLIASRNVHNDFRPLYAVKQVTKDGRPNTEFSRQQVRLANTSSGSFAPSTIATSSRHMKICNDPQANLNVFEDSDHLPSLPVPNLHETLEKLKESISPVAMNSAEFVHTLELIDEFAQSAGPKLDLLLRKKADQVKNWLTHDWWTNEVYLKSRQSLVINSNPAMIYPNFPFEVNNQRALINVTSQLISGIIDFKLSLMHGYNPEATSADNECRLDPNTCYNQYKNIFGSTRLPGEQVDTVKFKNLTDSPGSKVDGAPTNIVISYRGKFFEIQLTDLENEKGRIDRIRSILDKIITSMKDGDHHHDQKDKLSGLSGAGVLTTANRDNWAQVYRLLDIDSMDAIQEAQFVVCIDTIPAESEKFTSSLVTSPPDSEAHSAALGRQILHGDSANVGNRWFDKALQLIVVADEQAEKFLGAGINYEHSFSEGTIITKMIEYSFDKAVQNNRDSSNNANFFAEQQVLSQEPAIFRQLRMFDESNLASTVEHLKQAQLDFAAHIGQFDLSYLAYKQYGSNAIKSWHFSPDSWFQTALQSGYYNLHKRLGPCYESASTRRFAYGRTETIRSLTKEVAQFCYEPKFETMKAAIKSHKAYAISAGNAEAIDRILMGYKMTFNELKANNWAWGLPSDGHDELIQKLNSKQSMRENSDADKIGQNFDIEQLFTEDELATAVAFFNNELILRSFRFSLSTSQVSSMHPNIYMTYGPLLADGYGCCYNITGQQIVAAITANSSNQSFSCEVNELKESVRGSLDKMRDLVEEQRSKSYKN